MSDLISRSELIKPFEKIQSQKDVIGLYFVEIIDEIKEQPTAYDIDKVVEELERAKHEIASEDYCRSINDKEKCDDRNCFECCAEYLIEIVKHGCVSDDVCEWKYTKEIMDNAEFKVGCNQNALKRGIVPNNFSYHDFKYCPYCGKKIKVVE